jgi:tetratricopeptide (TPR) repeat protein
MTSIRNDSKTAAVYLFLLLFALPLQLMAASESGLVDPGKGANYESGTVPTAADLWKKAVLSEEDQDKRLTADLYADVHKQFPETPEAEKALWKSIGLNNELAKAGERDWEVLRNQYREYVSYYPGGKHVAQAYLGQGIALHYMDYQREALTYFKLCIKRFPEEPLASEAKLWLAKVLTDVGKTDEAEEIYNELATTVISRIKLRAVLGKAEILNSRGDYSAALKIYHDLNARNSNFFLDDIEALRIFGKTNIFAGNVERGQNQLIHYLNLSGDPMDRADVLFEIGESYWRQKKFQAAWKMYARVIEEGNENRRSVLFSHMRIAQYLDDPNRPRERWDKPSKLTDPEGDKPYLAVLDQFYNDPLAQEARDGLFWRFKARDDLKNMLDYGKNYLRLARLNEGTADKQETGRVFLALVETLLQKKKYKDLYDIYYSEYETVKDYPDGRLLYNVGRAMEALGLYEQAAVVYYRAMKWPLSPEDKIDLYYRRANVYLFMKDYEAAERLLTYLREIYKGKPEAGEIYSLSGRLREGQNKDREALEFYRKAVEETTSPDKAELSSSSAQTKLMPLRYKKSSNASAAGRLALLLDGSAALPEIEGYRKNGYLSGVDLQKMYASAGDILRKKGEYKKAAEIYGAALVEGLPTEGEVVQSVHLYLGDSLLAVQKREEGLKHYQEAAQGKDPLLKKMAQERLNQNDIEMGLSKLNKSGGR